MFAADYYFCLDNGDCVVVVGMRFTVTIKSRIGGQGIGGSHCKALSGPAWFFLITHWNVRLVGCGVVKVFGL